MVFPAYKEARRACLPRSQISPPCRSWLLLNSLSPICLRVRLAVSLWTPDHACKAFALVELSLAVMLVVRFAFCRISDILCVCGLCGMSAQLAAASSAALDSSTDSGTASICSVVHTPAHPAACCRLDCFAQAMVRPRLLLPVRASAERQPRSARTRTGRSGCPTARTFTCLVHFHLRLTLYPFSCLVIDWGALHGGAVMASQAWLTSALILLVNTSLAGLWAQQPASHFSFSRQDQAYTAASAPVAKCVSPVLPSCMPLVADHAGFLRGLCRPASHLAVLAGGPGFPQPAYGTASRCSP